MEFETDVMLNSSVTKSFKIFFLILCFVSNVNKAKVWGPENGRPVIAIHGWLDNCGTFDTLIPLLPKDLRVVAVDM